MRMAKTPEAAKNPRKVLGRCKHPDCGKPFYGHMIQKYCDEHRDSKKTRVTKLYGSKDNNIEFNPGFSECATLILVCAHCGDEYRIRYIPKVTIYPRFCDQHRNPHQRRDTVKDDEASVQKYGDPIANFSGIRTNIHDDDDEAFIVGTGDSKHVSMAIKAKLDIVNTSDLAKAVVDEIIAGTGTDEQIFGLTVNDDNDIVDVDIGVPADDKSISDDDFLAMASAKLSSVNESGLTVVASVSERTGDGSSPAIVEDDDDNVFTGTTSTSIVNDAVTVGTDSVEVGAGSVKVAVAEPVAPKAKVWTSELTANPLRDGGDDAGIQRSGAIDLGVAIKDGAQVIYSRTQKPGCNYELSGFVAQYDHGTIRSALKVLLWFKDVDSIKACFEGQRFTDPEGNSGVILSGAPVVCKDDMQVLNFIQGEWRRP